MIESHTSAIRSALSRTRRGVKPLFTSWRRRRWSGSSMSIIIGRGPLSGRMPCELENVAGSTEIALTSA